jgi:hypothetical protein
MSTVLSSNVLEQQFGPTEVEILLQNDRNRIICTRAVYGGQVLEISYVNFVRSGVAGFPAVHQTIVAGESMGKAFRKAGIRFHRIVQAAHKYAVPESFKQWFDNAGAATVVDVTILVGPDRTTYAKILEIYSPLVKWPQSTGQPTPAQLEQLRWLNKFLSDEGRQA